MLRRRHVLLASSALLLIAVVITAVFLIHARRTPSYEVRQLQVSDQTIRLQVADSDAKRELGLGKRSGMARNEGMVFTFDRPQQLCFWMKDMRFPLDMIWLDASQRVVQVKADIAPDSYPTTYCSPATSPASYVIELNAGMTQQLAIQQGQYLRF